VNKELALFGHDLFGDPVRPPQAPVAARFAFPPFSILDAKQGDWRARKRAWLDMGIKGEVGRDANLLNISSTIAAEFGEGMQTSSVFDPVLCELAYRWWCPEGGQVVDPFAGGSVRGIVAGALGRRYWGCDLRQEQIDANEMQGDEIAIEPRPVWVCDDALDCLDESPYADFVFSCPPYGDLEKYSDDPRDLSNMEWHTFVAEYKRIVLRAVKRLKPDRFACFVVGDFRDSKGFYRNFVSETIAGFEACGARLYNEAILATSIGSASMRVSKQFAAGRKLAKVHQNVLVFCKGDWRRACAKLPDLPA